MTLFEKMVSLQAQIKAPKDKNNSFGGYKYRSAEQIFEAFKPYGEILGLVLTVSDEMVQVGTYIYVKATATLIDAEKPSDNVSVTAWAREAESKKGMDSAQVTGATSSYARKYALNGLLLLDDTKDPDTDEYRRESDRRVEQEKPVKKTAKKDEREEIIRAILTMAEQKGYTLAREGLETASVDRLKATLKQLEAAPKKGEIL